MNQFKSVECSYGLLEDVERIHLSIFYIYKYILYEQFNKHFSQILTFSQHLNYFLLASPISYCIL